MLITTHHLSLSLFPTVAPEIFLTQHYNLKVDVYSFAIVLHCMLSLARPFEKYNAQLHTLLVCKEGVRPPIPHEWPTELRDLLRYGWAHRPSDRPSIKEARQTLERLAQRVEVEGVPPPSAQNGNGDPLLLQHHQQQQHQHHHYESTVPSCNTVLDKVCSHPRTQKAGKLLRKMERQMIRGAITSYPQRYPILHAGPNATNTERKEHPQYRKHLRSNFRL
jgi:hypothetical protein